MNISIEGVNGISECTSICVGRNLTRLPCDCWFFGWINEVHKVCARVWGSYCDWPHFRCVNLVKSNLLNLTARQWMSRCEVCRSICRFYLHWNSEVLITSPLTSLTRNIVARAFLKADPFTDVFVVIVCIKVAAPVGCVIAICNLCRLWGGSWSRNKGIYCI